MNGIVININPVIFHLGAFELRWYSLAIMLAVVAAVLVAVRQAKKKGIASEEIYSTLPLAVWVVVGGIVGARLFHVIDQFGYYVSNPLQIWQIQQGGLAIWGALVGGVAATFIYTRIRHIPLGRLGDTLAPALLTGHIIGRIGCIINGDTATRVTSLPWGFIYTHPNASISPDRFGLPVHPYAVYEMLWNAVALLVILRLGRHVKKDGLIFLSYVSLYALGRLVLGFVRLDEAMLWGLQPAQLIAVFTIAGSVAAMVYLTRKRLVPEKSVEP